MWTVAAPCEERISLHALRGSTLAVDLAGWVVQNNTAPGLGSGAVTRPHLRNIFFRVQALVNIDILPIVVLDGAVPKEKAETVRARNALAWGARPTTESPKRQQRRPHSGRAQRHLQQVRLHNGGQFQLSSEKRQIEIEINGGAAIVQFYVAVCGSSLAWPACNPCSP